MEKGGRFGVLEFVLVNDLWPGIPT